MSDGSIRTKRVAGTIRKHLSSLIAREARDPRLAVLSIDDVSMTGDLGLATVRVRLMMGEPGDGERRAIVQALTRMAPGLRAQLAPILRMRRVPDLRFFYDDGQDRARHIEALLHEIEADRRSAQQAPEPDTKPQAPGAADSSASADSAPELSGAAARGKE